MSLQEKMAMAYQLGASQAIKTASDAPRVQRVQEMRNDLGARRRTSGALRVAGTAGLGYGMYQGLGGAEIGDAMRRAAGAGRPIGPYLGNAPNYQRGMPLFGPASNAQLATHAAGKHRRMGAAMYDTMRSSAASMPTRAMQHIKGIGTAYGAGGTTGLKNALTHMGGSPLAKGLGAAAALGLGYKGISGINSWMSGGD